MNVPRSIPNKIYETIVQKIIQKCNKEPLDPPSYKPFDITSLPKLTESIAEVECWANVAKCVSREKLTALLLLYATSKAPLPIFTTTATFQLKQFMNTLEGRFITPTPTIRKEFIAHYCKYKQTYNAFSKLARLWQIRKTPIRIQKDLYMNELDVSHPATFQLLQPGGIYLFSLSNLARIIVDSITNQSGMFVEPLPIKNPYTNNPLSKSDLYNIYFRAKFQHLRTHEMFEKFFRCEFNVFEFRRKHETELRDLAVLQYANTSSVEELSQDVSEMLMSHQMTGRIKIASGFPQKKMVEAMLPFLRLYLLERYSFSSVTRQYSKKKLCLALKQFAAANPNYGRRIDAKNKKPKNNMFEPNRECYAQQSHVTRWVPTFEIATPNPASNPFTSPTFYELNQQMRSSSNSSSNKAEQNAYITEFTMNSDWCPETYLKSHIYDEDVFDRYVEIGDKIETYYQPLDESFANEPEGIDDEESEWTEWNPPDNPSPARQRIPHQPIVLSEIANNASNILMSLGAGNNRLMNTVIGTHVQNLPVLDFSVSYQEQIRNTRNLTGEQIQENARAILARLGHSTVPNYAYNYNAINNNIIHNDLRIYNNIRENNAGTLNNTPDESEDEIVVNNTDTDSDVEWMDGEDSVS